MLKEKIKVKGQSFFNFEEHANEYNNFKYGIKENIFYERCEFNGVKFEFSKLMSIDFKKCLFNNCEIECCNFLNVSFNECVFKSTDFAENNFFEVNNENCLFEKCHFAKNTLEYICGNDLFLNQNHFYKNMFTNGKIKNSRFDNSSFKMDAFFMFNSYSNIFSKTLFAYTMIDKRSESFKDCFEHYENKNLCVNNIWFCQFVKTEGKDNLSTIPVCPAEGSFIGYKKCLYRDELNKIESCIVTLKISKDAKRFGQLYSGKCRCSKAKVIKIETLDGTKLDNSLEVFSAFNPGFIYKIDKVVKPEDGFCKDKDEECGSGIHFFMTKKEAIEYTL